MPLINDILPKVSLWKSSPSQLTEMPLVAAVLSKAFMYKSSLPTFLFTEGFLWMALKATISALILKLIITCVYRIFFHPFAKYPGPWTAKVSDFYAAYHNGKGQFHIQTKIGHRKYGPVFRQGPNKLVFNSPQALHDIYSSKEVLKSFAYETFVPGPGQYNIFTVIDSTAHRHKSKMLSKAFSDRTMKEFEPTMLYHIDLFVKNLMSCCDERGSTWSIPINMTKRSGYLQYDVMGKFGFGSSFDMQTKSDNHFLMDAVEAICLRGGIYSQYPKLARLPIDKFMAFSKIAEMRTKYSNLVTRLVKARVAAPKNFQPDIFKFLVDATNAETGKGFTEAELWADSRFLLIAGADTSKTLRQDRTTPQSGIVSGTV
ncbi:uncharacterized protein BP5553_10192 [Venustampulla echinocandica]|uniref:Cytochrome P450 n=1 Tax=Venustampulla echinocandica TaxID=2656787 RepID=A0A370TAK7_9HELO|nr:uncharacterized protein BP5553_10192 [Venustampulla echinocandica]RDL30847.1 hypothetical protein BP5553_10192 [Venustampulla echinocandica]